MSSDTLAAIAVALGAGWASGLNAYAAVLVLGAAQQLGLVTLPHDLQVLASPWVMGVAAILFALNFLADKIPYVDSINDMLQTFVRVPAGALLAYGAAATIWVIRPQSATRRGRWPPSMPVVFSRAKSLPI